MQSVGHLQNTLVTDLVIWLVSNQVPPETRKDHFWGEEVPCASQEQRWYGATASGNRGTGISATEPQLQASFHLLKAHSAV